MTKFLIRRLGQAVIVLFFVSVIAFVLVRISPGNPAQLMLPENATEEQINALSEKMGLDKPIPVQYLIYMKGVLTGDLGASTQYNLPCWDLIVNRLGATVQLALFTGFIVLLISLPLGVIAGINQGKAVDVFAMFFALAGQSISNIWLAMMLILLFATRLGWLPTFGYGTFACIIMPAVTLGYPISASITRMLRSGLIDVLKEDYITAIRAKGLPEGSIHFKYALKNAIIPVILLFALQIGFLLGGALIAEQIFAWPGLGSLTIGAINTRDYPLIQSVLLVVSSMYVLINIVIDIVNSLIDPRITLH